MNGCGDSLRAASGGRGQRGEPTAVEPRALRPMSRQARGLGRIFRPRSRDKRTGQVKEFSICDQYTIQADLFSRAILENSTQAISLEDAVKNMAVIDAIFHSETSGAWEAIPQKLV